MKGPDFKLDYMARLFRSIRNKRFESYVIQRIWHQLNDERVKFVSQQYFKRTDGSYALADLYLPQINLVVEIDEKHHNTVENTVLDSIRSQQIQSVSGAKILRISICKDFKKDEWCTLAEVNAGVSEVVVYIKQEIDKMGEQFVPWSGANMLSPTYYINKKYFSVLENDYVRNIDDAAAIFNTKAIHKGYLRAGGFDVPGKQKELVWLPSVNSRLWSNILSDDGKVIEEYQKIDSKKRDEHVKAMLMKNETRITFFKKKDALGFNFYKFVGVFNLDRKKSEIENKCIWVLSSDTYNL